MTIYGYARVSTDGQTLPRRTHSSTPPAAPRSIPRRPAVPVLTGPSLRSCCDGWTGVMCLVTRLDRLARSTRDLLNILDTVAKAGGRLQVAGGYLGGHHDGARPADADRFWAALLSSSAH
jgi:hypothetical protein